MTTRTKQNVALAMVWCVIVGIVVAARLRGQKRIAEQVPLGYHEPFRYWTNCSDLPNDTTNTRYVKWQGD